MYERDEIYRPSAVAAAKTTYGVPLSDFGIKSWMVTLFLAALFIAVILFAATSTYSRTETVIGQVIPEGGLVKVASMRPGIVKSISITDGQLVHAGDEILKLSSDLVLGDGDSKSSKLAENNAAQMASTIQQGAARKKEIIENIRALEEKIQGSKLDIDAYQQQVSVQQARLDLVQQTVTSVQSLADKQYASQLTLRQYQEQLLEAKQNVLQLKQTIDQSRSNISQMESQLASYKTSFAEADAALELSKRQVEAGSVDNQSSEGGRLVAERNGIITGLQAKPGDLINPGQTLAVIVPSQAPEREYVSLWVPSRSIGFLQLGDRVRVMFDAFPFQTFGAGKGIVTEIAAAPLGPSELPILIDTKEQMYEVKVSLDRSYLSAYGKIWLIRPGQRVTADLVLDKKSFLSWALDPLSAIRKRAG